MSVLLTCLEGSNGPCGAGERWYQTYFNVYKYPIGAMYNGCYCSISFGSVCLPCIGPLTAVSEMTDNTGGGRDCGGGFFKGCEELGCFHPFRIHITE